MTRATTSSGPYRRGSRAGPGLRPAPSGRGLGCGPLRRLVQLHVSRRRPQERRVVAEESKALIATLAQQLTRLARLMVMVEMTRIRFPADGAAVALRGAHLIEFRPRYPMDSQQVGVLALL